MKKYFLFLTFGALLVATQSASAACTGELSVRVKDGLGRNLSKAQITVYQEGRDSNGLKRPVKQVGSARVDDTVGLAKVNFTATTEAMNYVVKVTNSTLKNRDFLFYEKVNASCGYQGSLDLTLSSLRITVQDPLINTLKNVAITVGAQGVDAANKIVSAENLGTFNTGELGRVDVLAPTYNQAAVDGAYFYIIAAKNARGQIFYEETVTPSEATVKYVTVKISDAVITVRDRANAQTVPNFKVLVYEQTNSGFGGYAPGKLVDTLTSDNKGRVYVQLPAGNYYMSYQNSNGEKLNTPVVITKDKRHDVDLWLEDYRQEKCQYKSDFRLVLRDYQQRVIGNVNYNLYEQTLDANGWPAISSKLLSGKIDNYGLANTKLSSVPTQKYLLEVCSQAVKGACFWFANINFVCSAKLSLEKVLPAVNIVLRDTAGKLLVGQKFKIYQQTLDIDGKKVVDKNALLGNFTLPTTGKLTVYLPAKNLQNESLSYFVVVEQVEKQIAQAEFVGSDLDQTLDYRLTPGKLQLRVVESPVINPVKVEAGANVRLSGRILLQVEGRGEAWYIDPVTGLRYYLAGAAEAYALMRTKAIGMTNADLAKIPVSVDGVTGLDSDADGLPDRLEIALGSDMRLADTDDDAYSDYQEFALGFNPRGPGRLAFSQSFANKYKGRILLQVEGKGEAWYVNPVNGQRYYLGAPEDAYQLMRRLGLGAKDSDLEKIGIGQ